MHDVAIGFDDALDHQQMCFEQRLSAARLYRGPDHDIAVAGFVFQS